MGGVCARTMDEFLSPAILPTHTYNTCLQNISDCEGKWSENAQKIASGGTPSSIGGGQWLAAPPSCGGFAATASDVWGMWLLLFTEYTSDSVLADASTRPKTACPVALESTFIVAVCSVQLELGKKLSIQQFTFLWPRVTWHIRGTYVHTRYLVSNTSTLSCIAAPPHHIAYQVQYTSIRTAVFCMRPYTTYNPYSSSSRDRSVWHTAHSLQRWVSTKSSISQLFFTFVNINSNFKYKHLKALNWIPDTWLNDCSRIG